MTADSEYLLQSDAEKDENRNLVSNILSKAVRSKQSKDPIDIEFLSINKKTKRFLKDNLDLIVLSADKGNKTVFVMRSEYKFTDYSTYEMLFKIEERYEIWNKLKIK